jgi:predicted N-formylglutamate amidohydrolase
VPRGEPPVVRPEPARVLTCEHARFEVPAKGFDLRVLQSHVGWDEGALPLAQALAEAWGAPLIAGGLSRLWVDLNRSADAPDVVPERAFGVDIPANVGADRARRLRTWHAWRSAAYTALADGIEAHGRVVHWSIHSFSPELDPVARTYAVGVLFDPSRLWEAQVASEVLVALRAAGFDARANEPYLGSDDGHTTARRKDWPDAVYAGLEIEMNQALNDRERARLAAALASVDLGR